MSEITFLSDEAWDEGRMVAIFWASGGDKPVPCARLVTLA
jgi:hypothetical protein